MFMLFMDNSSSRIVDWQISNNWSILLTRSATSCMGEIIAFVSQTLQSLVRKKGCRNDVGIRVFQIFNR